MKTNILLLFLLILISFSCKKGEGDPAKTKNDTSITQKNSSQNLNISFLLDLSDRIDPTKNPNPTMEYWQRDVQYINSVQKAFINHIKSKKIMQLNDQMQVFFSPEPQNPEINKLTQQLKVNFDKNTSKDKIVTVEETFSTAPAKIYQSAINDRQFVGSDIWRFFKTKVKDYCLKDNHHNLLVIITDGYLYHQDSKFTEGNKTSYMTPEYLRSKGLEKSNFKDVISQNGFGFIPATDHLENLEVLVLGINPSKSNPNDEDIIQQYWGDWFTAMGIKKFEIKSADLPSNLDPVIKKIVMNN